MKKRILISIIMLVIIVIGLTRCNAHNTITTNYITDNYTKEDLIEAINQAQSIKDNAHTMAESARNLGWQEDDKLIQDLQKKWHAADNDQIQFQKLLNEIIAAEEKKSKELEEARLAEEAKWNAKAAEYPAATQIWRYMKNQGWNDYVCAGIMGNLMAEVGGQTLDIKYTISSKGYYGMCQWNTTYYSQIRGANLQTQCDFLRDTIKYEFDTYGFKYQKGFDFNSFLNMTNAEQAALAFAKSYERCASFSHTTRQKNALKAYNYFVN